MMRSPRNLLVFFLMGLFFGGALVGGVMALTKKANTGHLALDKKAEAALIATTLAGQTDAWNRGDIEAFMEDYWKSPDLQFTSNNSITKGWQPTLQRYLVRYPDRKTMGTLKFTDETIEVLSPQDALVFGRFTLMRDDDKPTGLYTLHLKKMDGSWKIVSDHTSTD